MRTYLTIAVAGGIMLGAFQVGRNIGHSEGRFEMRIDKLFEETMKLSTWICEINKQMEAKP